jgi:hypothetical protein
VPHAVADEEEEDDDEDTLDMSRCLMPPTLEQEQFLLKVHCWEAQHLPAMDSMALDGKACDPFCTIRFGGSGRVKTKAVKKTQNPVSK